MTGLVAVVKPGATATAVAISGKAFAGGTFFGGTLGFSKLVEKVGGFVGFGQKIRHYFGPSQMKVGVTTRFAREILIEIKRQFARFVSKLTEIQTTADERSSRLTNENDRFSGEKSELNKELNKLTEWSNKLTESTKRLQNVRDGFDELKLG